MKKQNVRSAMLVALLLVACLSSASVNVQAQFPEASQTQAQTQSQAPTQPQTPSQTDETNFDTQLYLLVGTNQDVADSKIPSSLDGVMKTLRATMPFKNYRLAATVLNRVKNEGRLDTTWISGPFTAASATAPATTPSTLKVRMVKLVREEGQPLVQMSGFYFSSRVAIPVGAPVATNNPGPPVFNYESTNLATDISMREAEPVIVGTLNTGVTGDAIILVMSAKRAQK